MTVFAPFRFAPIHRWVHFPEWAPLVSHDVPFKDGLSGWIEMEIKAETPLLVGGARRKPGENREGEVWPYQLPDGRWAIPPSSLQGMVRSILEVGTFARLGPWVDDKRFGIRDLTQPAEPYYQRRLNRIDGFGPIKVDPNVQVGWLRRIDDERFELKPCSFARIEYDDLVRLTGVQKGPVPDRRQDRRGYDRARVWQKKSDVDDRYDWVPAGKLEQSLQVEPVTPQPRHKHRAGTPQELSIAYRKVTGLAGSSRGRIVLTGNPSDPPRNPRASSKHMEFFFFGEEPVRPLERFKARFEEFLSIHQPEDGRKENANWAYFRDQGYPEANRRSFSNGGWMPIFYLPDDAGGIESFGLAFMFKLAHEKRTRDLLANSSPDHRPPQDGARADFPSLVFGSVAGDKAGGGLKRRAAFDTAVAILPEGGNLLDPPEPTVLLSPKPSYFPIYVRQPEGAAPGKLPMIEGQGRDRPVAYATYTPIVSREQYRDFNRATREHKEPELAGVKIWPVKPFALPPLPPEIRDSRKVQTRLRALPAGTRFEKVRMRFHNLRPMELGALVWALTFGDPGAVDGAAGRFRHRLGMGKPYGLGQLAIRLTDADILPNDDGRRENLKSMLDSFVTHMDGVCRADGPGTPWLETAQVKALLRAADPSAQAGERLDYMQLEDKNDRNNPDTFVGARIGGWFMPAYVEEGKRAVEARGERRAVGGPAGTGGEPRLGARVRRKNDGRMGEIVGEPKDQRSPVWHVRWEGDDRPQWYKAIVFDVVG